MFDRLLAALINLPSRSSSTRLQLGRHVRGALVSPTAVGVLVTYYAITAMLYPIATLVPGARASVLIAEAAFATWGFALSFIAGGRCTELRRVGQLADDSRRRLVAYVRLKRHLAAETESGRPVMRHQRQQLKLLRRQLDTNSIDGQRSTFSYAEKQVSVDLGKIYQECTSSSSGSSLSLSIDDVDPVNGTLPPSAADLTSVRTMGAVTHNGRPDVGSVVKATTSARNNRPTDLPLWSATGSIVSGGVTVTPVGYSPIVPGNGLTSTGHDAISSASDENADNDGLASEVTTNGKRTKRSTVLAKKHRDTLSSDMFDDVACANRQVQNTSLGCRRFERFAIDCDDDINPTQQFSTRQRFLARFRFRSIGRQKDGVGSKRSEMRGYSELRRGWTTSDAEIDNNSDDGGSRFVDHSVSGWKSEATLLSRLSTSETVPSLAMPLTSCGGKLGQTEKASLILETDACESESSGTANSISDCRRSIASRRSWRLPQLSAPGSPGYAADMELESPNDEAVDSSSIATDRRKLDGFLTRPQCPIADVVNEFRQLLSDADDGNNMAAEHVGAVEPAFVVSSAPQSTTMLRGRRRRTRLAEVVALRRSFVVSCLTVGTELVMCSVQIYAMFGIFGVLSNVRIVASPLWWLTFQTIGR